MEDRIMVRQPRNKQTLQGGWSIKDKYIVNENSKSVNICKFHGEIDDNAFHLLQIGEEQENMKNKNN